MLKTLFFSVWLLFHPVHVSVTSIDFIPEMDSFKVFVRMYFDDFLLDCELNGMNIQKTGFSEDNSTSREVLAGYLRDMVIIMVNEKQLEGKLQDVKLADNELSMNLEYFSRKKPKTITVKNLIMTGLYNDQSNMIILK
jgi:hypothetical protein